MNTKHESSNIENQLYEKVIKPSDDIKFACLINKHGKALYSFNEDCLNMNSKKKEMLFMETMLQTKMNKDFDNDLGVLRCNVTEREDGLKCVSAPLSSSKMVFALMNRDKDHNYFVNNISKLRTRLNDNQ